MFQTLDIVDLSGTAHLDIILARYVSTIHTSPLWMDLEAMELYQVEILMNVCSHLAYTRCCSSFSQGQPCITDPAPQHLRKSRRKQLWWRTCFFQYGPLGPKNVHIAQYVEWMCENMWKTMELCASSGAAGTVMSLVGKDFSAETGSHSSSKKFWPGALSQRICYA